MKPGGLLERVLKSAEAESSARTCETCANLNKISDTASDGRVIIGHKYRRVVTDLKVKKGVPTVILVSGREYVLRSPDQFNMQPKPQKK